MGLDIISAIEEKIAQLEQAKALLLHDYLPAKKPVRSEKVVGKRWVKPAGSHISRTGKVVGLSKKRHMSDEGRARIAAAQRLRWSKQKRAA